MSETEAVEVPVAPKTDWREVASNVLDLAAALLLGFSTVCMGYSAFQAGAWEGETLKMFNESQTAIAASNDESMQAVQGAMMDTTLVVKIVELSTPNAEELLSAYMALMSDEGRELLGLPAGTAAPVTAAPAGSPDPAAKYEAKIFEKALAKRKEGERLFEEANAADENGDAYEMVGIVLTTATFFAGLAPIMRRIFMKVGLLGVGGFIWFIGMVWMLFLPSPP